MIPITNLTGRLGNQMFQWAFLYAQFREGNIPDLYLQNYEYFDKYRSEIKHIYGDGIGKIAKVGIHVRRGKNPLLPSEPAYSENSFYNNICDTDYYQRAMALFPGKEFLIFSDDHEWCKTHFPGIEIHQGNELEDFNGLASCEGIIMANSSFSFWCAYLSTAQVVAPKEDTWYKDGMSRCKLLKEWKQI